MARARMRPAFQVEASGSADDLAEILRARLAADSSYIEGTVARGQCALAMPRHDQRFWSPSLDLMFEDIPGTFAEPPTLRIWGTFSPRPEIWTAFVFTISILVIFSLFAFIYGIALLALDKAPYVLVIPPIAALIAGFLYLAALVGQGLSISDMYRLRAFLDDCLRELETSFASGGGGGGAQKAILTPSLHPPR